MNEQGKSTPAWLLLLLAGVVVLGAIYSLIAYGVNYGKSPEQARRESLETPAVAKKSEVSRPEKSDAAIAEGQKIFSTVCFACHGANLEGGVGPNLSDATWLHSSDANDIHKLILKGVPAQNSKTGIAMPEKGGKMDMTPDQAWSLVYFLESKNSSIAE